MFRITPLARPFLALAHGLLAPLAGAQVVPSVAPGAETDPVPTGGDAADDAVVWIHPTRPALSVVIGTDKESGLAVYDLSGGQRQFVPGGRLNNVDLRYGFPLAGTVTALVTSGEREQNVLAAYALFQGTRTLHDVVARAIPFGMDVYGCCMYRSPLTGEYYFFGTSDAGVVEQWRLFDNGAGRVDAERVRTFDVGGQCEGCVADDDNRWLFVGEEEVGIWRYGAEPGDGGARVLVDSTGPGGNLAADVEGLALYQAAGGGGYLIASSQGDSRFVVYERAAPHALRLDFRVGDAPALAIDAVSGTDGLDVTNAALGNRWPGGVLAVQDDSNPGANQNFKLVDWRDVAAAAVPALVVDPDHDALGARCPTAARAYRFGAGVNPFVLTSAAGPVLGSDLAIDLDCGAHAPGRAVLNVYARPAAGVFVPAGEVLVDRTSPRLARLVRLHSGASVRFDLAVPADVGLCGLTATSQGTCHGAPGAAHSNALDLVLGW